MSRIRTVKPELFKHEDLFDAERLYLLPLRLAFIGLFSCCDCEGRFRWQPRRLKLDILPYDEVDFSGILDALAASGFIVKYEHQGKYYGCIPSWSRHQQINHREAKSELPALSESVIFEFQVPNEQPVHSKSEPLSTLSVEASTVSFPTLQPLAQARPGMPRRNMERNMEEEGKGNREGERKETTVASEMLTFSVSKPSDHIQELRDALMSSGVLLPECANSHPKFCQENLHANP